MNKTRGITVLNIVKQTALDIGCEFYENEPMSNRTSFKTGGPADLLVCPGNIDALITILKVCKENNIRTFIIGNGSNILVSDNGLSGVVVMLSSNFSEIKLLDEETVYCQSGVSMTKLCRFALEHSLSGLEFAFGIPGTAGGAAYMNAGAYGGEMKDVLVKCEHIDENMNISSFSDDELKLGYRKSVYTDSSNIITSLTLKLKKADYNDIKAKMDENLFKRKDKQPLEYPSAGSTFKRPEGYFAGALIEECGLKGYSVGGAQVSEKHAGFVINKNHATSSDVLKLISHIQDTVYKNKGVLLETEVKIFE